MRLIKLGDKEELALRAVVYGCNTNKRLQGASYLEGIHSESPKEISFYSALEVVDEMMDAPTINPESLRPKGKWIDNIDKDGFLCNAWRKCSVCGGLNFSKCPPFCPNCGADMRGESNERKAD